MGSRHPASFAKRQREAAKRAKRQEKAEKRAARRAERSTGEPEDGAASPEVDESTDATEVETTDETEGARTDPALR